MLGLVRRVTVAASLGVVVFGLASNAHASPAPSTPAPLASGDLDAARALFAEALRDEEQERFDAALEKFQRVLEVRDTAAIRYRIGTCQEALHRFSPALASYEAAARFAETDAATVEVIRASRARAVAIDKRVARLTLTLAHPPANVEVLVDGVKIANDRLSVPLVVDAGTHVVTAAARDVRPFRSEVTLPEGGQASLEIPLDRATATSTATSNATATATATPRTAIAGWITMGAGGATVAGSVIAFLLRHGEIAVLNRSCPGGSCPAGSNETSLRATHDRAVTEGTVGATLLIAGAVGVAVGAVLVGTAGSGTPRVGALPSPRTLVMAPFAWNGGAGVAMGGEF